MRLRIKKIKGIDLELGDLGSWDWKEDKEYLTVLPAPSGGLALALPSTHSP